LAFIEEPLNRSVAQSNKIKFGDRTVKPEVDGNDRRRPKGNNWGEERREAEQFTGQQARKLKRGHGAQHALRLNFLATGKAHASALPLGNQETRHTAAALNSPAPGSNVSCGSIHIHLAQTNAGNPDA